MSGPGPDDDGAPLARPASPAELFTAFTWLALQGFGGVLPIAQRELVERRRWLRREDFLELLAVGQVLPGPNVVNLSLMIGDRFFGWRGALAAMAGMVLAPMAVVLVLAAAWGTVSEHPVAAGALRGMGAVSAGLIVAMGLKLLPALRSNPMGPAVAVAFAGATFAAVGWLRLPMAWAVPVLGLPAIAWAWWRLVRR
jgi:chromate transporter